jgi:hypothetical protein
VCYEIDLTGAESDTAKIIMEVAARCELCTRTVRELRYWPELEDWHSDVLSAAREEGVEVSDAGDGYPGGPFAREPLIDWWEKAWDGQANATLPHLTIEQSGGLDV